MGRRAVGVVGLAVLLGGCGLAGGSESAEYSDHIGTAVQTTSTTTSTTTAPRDVDTDGVYRDLATQLETEAPEATTPTTAPPAAAPDFCFDAEVFVFESTQMMLEEQQPAALQRARDALAALDAVIAGSPPDVAARTTAVRAGVASVVESPAAASVDTFRAAVQSLVAGPFGAEYDEWFTTSAAACGADLTSPYRPSSEGIDLVTEP